MRCDSQDGPMTDLFGQVVAPVQVSQQRAKVKGLKTLATSGLVGLASSASQSLQRSLESKLIKQLDSAGSTLFKQTWKRRITPLGRRYLEHTASALRIGDSAFTSLPTPLEDDANNGTRATGAFQSLTRSAQLSAVPTPDAHPDAPNTGTNRGENWGGARRRLTVQGLGPVANLAAVPTPMAGTPAQNGYNEAGSTDYERKMDVALGLRETTNGPKLAIAELEQDTKGTGNLTDLRKTENRQLGTQLSTVSTPRSSDVKTGSQYSPNMSGKSLTMDAGLSLTTVSTPTAQDHSRGNKEARPQDTGVPLSQQAALSTVSTPSSRDWKDTSGMSESGVDPDGSIRSRLDQLPRQARLAASGAIAIGGTDETKSTGQLAPDYSRWLQGLPPEWDDCAVTATRSFRKSRKRS